MSKKAPTYNQRFSLNQEITLGRNQVFKPCLLDVLKLNSLEPHTPKIVIEERSLQELLNDR